MDTTDSLRALAPKWSLAGDDLLLNLLKTSHQKLVSRCQEVNTSLEEMASALDDASISLQNVNNKFMGLSNSQFIESRVYDDDGDMTTDKVTEQEPSKTEVIDGLALLKQSLAILDEAHETARIQDDTDTDDSDNEISVVLKPKDPYAHRPLPYIIGSHSWKNKWHAGLVTEDSDSDSSTSRRDVRDVEEYSSDKDLGTDRHQPDITISESSSSFQSSRDKEVKAASPSPLSPADVAADLARRLGQTAPRVEEEEEYIPPVNTTKTIYKPQKPVASTIFFDEPPPLETYVQNSESEQEEDIFAEINKKQPYNNSSTAQNNLADDLFGFVTNENKEGNVAKQKSTIFDDESEPELFAEQPQKQMDSNATYKTIENDSTSTKKPVGGISLFGSTKGNEIGAAILKRNRRKSTSSENESDDNIVGNRNIATTEPVTAKNDKFNEKPKIIKNLVQDTDRASKEQDIFDSLFAKSQKKEQKIEKPANEVVKPKQNVKDLFSDNIFDDIDDIFSSSVKIPTRESTKNEKSIFDDDDLFSDVAKKPEIKVVSKNSRTNTTKSIFDSDDELFADVKAKNEPANDKENEGGIAKVTSVKESQISQTVERESSISTRDKEITPILTKPGTIQPKSKSIFDSDNDDDIFSDVKIKSKETESLKGDTDFEIAPNVPSGVIKASLKNSKPKVFESPSLFDEEEIDELFINANKLKINTEKVTEDAQKCDEIIIKVPEIVEENKNEFHKIPGIVETIPYIFPKNDLSKTSKDEKVFDDDSIAITKAKDTEAVKVLESTKESINTQGINDAIDVNQQKKYVQLHEDSVETENVTSISRQQHPIDEFSKIPADLYSTKIFDEVPVKKKQDVITQQQSSVFDNIFREPPAFEKAKDTKKVGNVNALFEDDSDDEALFFKRNDTITDEKPEIFSPSAKFGLFDDEPPALEVDFTPNDVINDFDNDDLFSSVSNIKETHTIRNEPPELYGNDEIPTQIKNSYYYDGMSSPPESNDLPKREENFIKTSKGILDSDEELFGKESNRKTIQNNHPDPIKDDSFETQKIGKINTKMYNINVQALIPGATPKKNIKDLSNEENTNDLDINNKDDKDATRNEDFKVEKEDVSLEKPGTNKENNSKTEVDGAISKSVSFQTKPESGVLDNNLSKQRAKIQVKRRPSSRRARHEAVRKSVIDIDDDTDNSSSFDEPRTANKKYISTEVDKSYKDEVDAHSKKQNSGETKKMDSNLSNIEKVESGEMMAEVLGNKDENLQKSPQSTTKVVYILNDEDIFNSKTQSKDDIIKTNEKNLFETDKDIFKDEADGLNQTCKNDVVSTKPVEDGIFSNKTEDIFKPSKKGDLYESNKQTDSFETDDSDGFFQPTKRYVKSAESNKDDVFVPDAVLKGSGITTIGNTYKDIKKKVESKNVQDQTISNIQVKSTKSLFDLSDDDDELFGKSKASKKVEIKTKLFDSDSEDDLFGKEKVKREVKKTKSFKKGLFGGDDDEELFVKTKPIEPKAASSKNSAKSTEAVYDDPLSMLDED